MSSHRYTASLRILSRTVRLAEMIACLGQPSSSHDIGDPVSPGRPDSPRHVHSRWVLDSTEQEPSLEAQLEYLLAFAEVHRECLAELVQHGECIDVACGIFTADDAQGGFTLDVAVMRRLVELGLDAWFDIY